MTNDGGNDWRADALGQSRHTRWVDELRQPLESQDPVRAAEICAAVTRAALRDFAPAVILLSAKERRRARALGAFTLLLFDFATQTGLEGERLAQINRLEFDLEAALAGEPPGQPVFVALAGTRPWPRDALDEILSAARRRVAVPRPENAREAECEAAALGAALAALFGSGDSESARRLAAGLLRLADLMALAEGVRRHRPRLSRQAYPEDWLRSAPPRAALDDPILAECRAIRAALSTTDLEALPKFQRRAAHFLRAAGLRLTAAVERLGGGLLDGPPKLGPVTRLYLLARARVG